MLRFLDCSMQTYPNNGFISYWQFLREKSFFKKDNFRSKALRTLQTGIKLTGLILKDAGIELFFLLIFWLIMTGMSQGRDIVVGFFEPGGIYGIGRAVYTILSVISFSVSMWIIPAYLFQKRDNKNRQRNSYNSSFRKHLFFMHRVLPLIPFWLLAFVLFNGDWIKLFFFFFSLAELGLLFLFNHKVKDSNKRNLIIGTVSFLFIVVCVIFFMIFQDEYFEAKAAYAVLLYLLSFLMFFLYHKADMEILQEHEKQDAEPQKPYSKFIINSTVYTIVLILHIAILFILFALPNLFTRFSLAPESILLYIFSVNIFFIDLFVYVINVTPQRQFITIVLLVVIALIYVSPWAKLNLKHYTMDANADSSGLQGKERLTFADRYAILKDSIIAYKRNGPFPIILVSGEGGGSRGGMWFSQNMINFDSVTHGRFRNYVFSISTVSGSSVGLSTLFSYWTETENQGGDINKWQQLPSRVYANNFVGSSIRGLLLTDFWKTIIPGSWTSDRNSVLQDEESYFTQKACNEISAINTDDIPDSERILKRDFMKFFYEIRGGKPVFRKDIPLVFINTCRSNDGRRGIFSPIKLSNDVFADAIDINGYLYDDSICNFDGTKCAAGRNKNISFGQACNTSELFPIFSTPAYIDRLGSFVDGGYHENSGLKTTLDVYEKLKDTLRKDPDSSKLNYQIYIVYLKNGSEEKNLYKPVDSEPPLTLPLKALSSQPFEGSSSYFEERTRFVGNRDSHAEYIEVKLNNRFVSDSLQTIKKGKAGMIEKQILRDLKKDTTLNIPLARWLSKSIIDRIKYNANQQLINNKYGNKRLIDLVDAINKQ
jgi:hypothetical protein